MPPTERLQLLQKLGALRPALPLTPEALQDFVEQRGVLLDRVATLVTPPLPPLNAAELTLVQAAQDVDRQVWAAAHLQLAEIDDKLRHGTAAGVLVDRQG